MLPPRLSQLPGILFHLRRSGAIRTSGTSPDLTAAFRLLASSLSTYNTLVLVQPTLLGYDVGRAGPTPLPLDGRSITPDRSLLLDSFRQVILCHSRQLAQLEKNVKKPPRGQAMFAQARPHGTPRGGPLRPVIECEQYGSKARYAPEAPLGRAARRVPARTLQGRRVVSGAAPASAECCGWGATIVRPVR